MHPLSSPRIARHSCCGHHGRVGKNDRDGDSEHHDILYVLMIYICATHYVGVKPVQPRSKQREIDRKLIMGIDQCQLIDDLGWTFEVTGLGEAISNTLNTL
ncbi:hypothetical protein BT96DRAFT_443223 [Gymnopus androsaceus JB14]|uniref:Uncharacterized protein n=1 Tax=Gymnopus androsaceus JB14 TaxID=1447944 RepID=A0A6A4GSI9_9AGAR|nr:hypothetical protein BT96DRAFT_443223 [Gymnopus androsaceus JB14]